MQWKIYSEEHKRRFEIKNDTFKVEKVQLMIINWC